MNGLKPCVVYRNQGIAKNAIVDPGLHQGVQENVGIFPIEESKPGSLIKPQNMEPNKPINS